MDEQAAREGELIDTANRAEGGVAMALLLEAGAVLASSLDPRTTMGQVAELTVPRLADLCVIDLLDEDGSIRDVAVAASQAGLAEGLEKLRVEHPVDPASEHPVAQVIRGVEPMLLTEMSDALLTSFAQGSEHARFMIAHGYRSAIVAPLVARGRTLGALSALRLGESPPYERSDLDLACELARRAALAIDNARLYSDLKRVQLAESFMSEASRVLASSLDYGETLQRVARLAVPIVASWCAVDVLGENGDIERVAVHHPDPEMVALAERLNRDYTQSPDEPTGVPEVIRTGESRIYTDIPPDALARYARDDEHLQLLAAIGATGVIIVPMIGADRITGAITLVSSGQDRRLSAKDLPLAERLARRAGTAVENARLYTERSRIAHTLQQALLPASLPALPSAEVRARYRAAGELNEVGGDFYDVFEAGREAWMLVIGDVCGKGPRAAGVTALARHTLRAAALSGQSPTQMLGMLHRALQTQPADADLCTVCLVRFQHGEETAHLRVALAGHPPPLLIDRNGESRQLGEPGTLLGVLDPIEVHEVEQEMVPDQTLLLYTDGLPEARRGDQLLGEDGLRQLCGQAPGLSLDGLLDHIDREALAYAGGSLRDDLALLALRLGRTAG